jgi:hypothetical protein
MPETLGSNAVATFTTPADNALITSSGLRANFNTLGTKLTAHDADASIHFLSGANLAARPAATGSYRKWMDRATGRVYVDTAAGTWVESGYLPTAAGGTVYAAVTLLGTHNADRSAAVVFEESNVAPTQRTYVRGGENGLVVENSEDGSGVYHTVLRADEGAAGETSLLLYDTSAGATVRVSRGAADSGGSGYRVLRIPN